MSKITIQYTDDGYLSIRSVQGRTAGEIEVTKDELKFLNKATDAYMRAQKMIRSKLSVEDWLWKPKEKLKITGLLYKMIKLDCLRSYL